MTTKEMANRQALLLIDRMRRDSLDLNSILNELDESIRPTVVALFQDIGATIQHLTVSHQEALDRGMRHDDWGPLEVLNTITH